MGRLKSPLPIQIYFVWIAWYLRTNDDSSRQSNAVFTSCIVAHPLAMEMLWKLLLNIQTHNKNAAYTDKENSMFNKS